MARPFHGPPTSLRNFSLRSDTGALFPCLYKALRARVYHHVSPLQAGVCASPRVPLTGAGFTRGAAGQGFGPVPRPSRDQGMISQGLPSALPGRRLRREGQGGTTCPGDFQTRALRELWGLTAFLLLPGVSSLVPPSPEPASGTSPAAWAGPRYLADPGKAGNGIRVGMGNPDPGELLSPKLGYIHRR